MTSVFRHSGLLSVSDTTYLVVSLKNGAPGSSSAVRLGQAVENIVYVVRPSRMPLDLAVTAARRSPILSSKPYGKVQVGVSMTPSKLMNSCTCRFPIVASFVSPLVFGGALPIRRTRGARIDTIRA